MVKADSLPLGVLLGEDVDVLKHIVLLFKLHTVLYIPGKKNCDGGKV